MAPTNPSAPTNPFSLAGRVALVTGSSRGLGRAMATALGRAGAKVAFNYGHSKDTAEAAFAAYRREGLEGCLVQGDVTDETEVTRMVAAITVQLGAIDILVPNATCAQPQLPIEEYDWAFHQRMLDFFVKSPYLLTRRALPHMKERRFGRIVNITSEVYHRSVSPFSAYVSAKGGQIGFSRSMSQELAPYGITVNTVAPGWIPVERHASDPQEMKDQYKALIPMKRWGTPEDVAWAVLYLVSEQASFVTGQTLCVNGGMTPW